MPGGGPPGFRVEHAPLEVLSTRGGRRRAGRVARLRAGLRGPIRMSSTPRRRSSRSLRAWRRTMAFPRTGPARSWPEPGCSTRCSKQSGDPPSGNRGTSIARYSSPRSVSAAAPNSGARTPPTLTRAEERFGVPPEIIVAIIGVESFYGVHRGRYRVLDALATLGFRYPRRSEFFLSELEAFVLLCDEEHLDATSVEGSYAGAMGISQFISSSYRRYAIDFDDDGSRDLMQSPQDAIGSVANYLAVHGWSPGAAIAVQAEVEGDAFRAVVEQGMKPHASLASIRASGVSFATYAAEEEQAALLGVRDRERVRVLGRIDELLCHHTLQPQPSLRAGGRPARTADTRAIRIRLSRVGRRPRRTVRCLAALLWMVMLSACGLVPERDGQPGGGVSPASIPGPVPPGGTEEPPWESAVLRGQRQAVLHPSIRARLRRTWNRVVVRTEVPRPTYLERRNLRHAQDDRGPQDTAPADVRLRAKSRHGEGDRGSRQRSRSVPWRPDHRPLLRRGDHAGDCAPGDGARRSAGAGVRYPGASRSRAFGRPNRPDCSFRPARFRRPRMRRSCGPDSPPYRGCRFGVRRAMSDGRVVYRVWLGPVSSVEEGG